MPESTRIDYYPSKLAFVFPLLIVSVCVYCVFLTTLSGWLKLLFVSGFVVSGAVALRRLQSPVAQVVLQADQWLLRMTGSQVLQPALLQDVVFVSRWLVLVDVLPDGHKTALRLYFAGDNTAPDAFRHLSRHIHRRRY